MNLWTMVIKKDSHLRPRGSIIASQHKIYLWKLRYSSYETDHQGWPLYLNGFISTCGDGKEGDLREHEVW